MMLTDASPLLRYVVAAVLSVIANLLAQEATVRGLPPAPLMVSIVMGTGVGFLVKHVIDKRWTFRESYTTHRGEIQRVTLSALFAVLTTMIFWSFELSFHALWQTDLAKYTGAVLGLSIGYLIKFRLDRRLVFREATV